MRVPVIDMPERCTMRERPGVEIYERDDTLKAAHQGDVLDRANLWRFYGQWTAETIIIFDYITTVDCNLMRRGGVT